MLKKYDLTRKTALITGAGGGIGRALALRLAESGMNLALCGRTKAKLQETLLQARDAAGAEPDILVLPVNLDGSAAVTEVMRAVRDHFSGLDVLINNAGAALNCPFEEITEADWDRIMGINARIPFLMCQQALPLLRTSEMPTIINIGSVVAHNGYACQAAYTASKHALIGFTRALAKEVYSEGIRVHMISPGSVYTDMIRVARPDLTPDGMITPEEIAELAAYLLEHRGNGIIDEIQLHRTGKEPFLT